MNSTNSQTTRIAKDFRWEMGHRLPFHNGGCQNIHGHSYRMRVTIEGTLDDNGMVLDYFDMKEIIDPLVLHIDHSFLCDDHDQQMLAFFRDNPMKHVIVPFRTTAENLAGWFLELIVEELRRFPNIKAITVRVHETERTYAERTRVIGY